MDQQELRALEAQCIQECAPPCTAACLIHVDVRAVSAEVSRGDFAAALKILKKTLPFPGIIGRLCDQPCQTVCQRGATGGAIAIAALERACADLGDTEPEKIILRASQATRGRSRRRPQRVDRRARSG